MFLVYNFRIYLRLGISDTAQNRISDTILMLNYILSVNSYIGKYDVTGCGKPTALHDVEHIRYTGDILSTKKEAAPIFFDTASRF